MKNVICFRKLVVVFILIFSVILKSSSQRSPNERIFYNTFKIVGDSLIGTCFRISDGSKNMIVTARHLFSKKHKSGDIVTYLFNEDSKTVTGKIYLSDNPKVDVALLEFNLNYKFDIMSHPVQGSYTLGQECFFVGYPLNGKYHTMFQNKNVGLIKKAIISGAIIEDGVSKIYLDGHNINGFSGSPIIAIDEKTNDFIIVGLISGFIADNILLNNNKEYFINLGIINAVSAEHIAVLWNTATKK